MVGVTMGVGDTVEARRRKGSSRRNYDLESDGTLVSYRQVAHDEAGMKPGC